MPRKLDAVYDPYTDRVRLAVGSIDVVPDLTNLTVIEVERYPLKRSEVREVDVDRRTLVLQDIANTTKIVGGVARRTT
jgi:hypothetical protein